MCLVSPSPHQQSRIMMEDTHDDRTAMTRPATAKFGIYRKKQRKQPKNAHAFLNRQVSQSLARYVFSSVFLGCPGCRAIHCRCVNASGYNGDAMS